MRHVERTQKEQKFKHLNLKVAAADAGGHGVELREDVLHARRRTRDKALRVGEELLRQHAGADVDILQNVGQAVRREGGVERDGDAVVVPRGELHLPLDSGAAHDREVSGGQKVMLAAAAVFRASLAAVLDLDESRRIRLCQTVRRRMHIVIGKLNAGENGIGCDAHLAVRLPETVDGALVVLLQNFCVGAAFLYLRLWFDQGSFPVLSSTYKSRKRRKAQIPRFAACGC